MYTLKCGKKILLIVVTIPYLEVERCEAFFLLMPKLMSPLSILNVQVITQSVLIVCLMLSKAPASTSMYIRSLYSEKK